MKKIKLLLGASFFIFSFSFSIGQSWLWGRQGYIIGLKQQAICEVATDAFGNAYLAGNYYPRISFGADTIQDTTLGIDIQAYYMKYNSNGNVQWVKQFVAFAKGSATSITTDAANRVLIAGDYNVEIRIGTYDLKVNGGTDVFLTRCDGNGTPLWANPIAGSGEVRTNMNTLATDKSKNVFISGYFVSGTVIIGMDTLRSDSTANIFLAKYDSNGKALWAKRGISISSNINTNDESYAVTTDLNGNSFVTGYYNGSIVFGTDTLVSPSSGNNPDGNVFIVKYDPNGNVLWARQSVIASSKSSAIGRALATDNAGNIYVAGSFIDTVSFGPDKLTGGELFFAKYKTNGNVEWVKSVPGYIGYTLSSDQANHVYLAGGDGTNDVTFGKYTLKAPANSTHGNSFVIEFDTTGNALCGSMLENGGGYTQVSLATYKTGEYIYEASIFYGDSIACGSDTLVATEEDPYVARWKNCTYIDQGISNITPQKNNILLYPNPSNGEFILQWSVVSGQSSVEIYNMLGEKVYFQSNIQNSAFNINLSNQPNGIYLYRVTDESGNLIGNGKFIIQK